jgi:hypothetical protein
MKTSRVCFLLSSSVAFLGLLISGCATNRSIVVTKELDRGLASYQKLMVQVSPSEEKYQPQAKNLGIVFLQVAKEQKLFSEINMVNPSSPPNGDLYLKLTVVGMKEGDKTMRAMNMGGDTEITVDASLEDVQGRQQLSAFQIKGNSRRGSHVTVGHFDTSMGGVFDDLEMKAMTAVSEGVRDYLKSHL